jgi:hypothetical protein
MEDKETNKKGDKVEMRKTKKGDRMNKKGISTILATVLLILLVISFVMIIYSIFSPIEKASKDKCYQDYAIDFCIKNNLTLYSSDREAGYFTCWVNKEKGEIKIFYIKGVCN